MTSFLTFLMDEMSRSTNLSVVKIDNYRFDISSIPFFLFTGPYLTKKTKNQGVNVIKYKTDCDMKGNVQNATVKLKTEKRSCVMVPEVNEVPMS